MRALVQSPRSPSVVAVHGSPVNDGVRPPTPSTFTLQRRGSGVTLDDLAELPALVSQLQQRVAQLEAQLPQPTDELVDADTASRLLDMSPRAVRQAAWRGSLPFVKVGRRLRFRRSDLSR
jgi:excisionase family DNA binding protein